MEATDSFQSSWTLADSLINDIANYQRTGRGAWLNGNLDKYFWSFEVIIRILYGMLTPEEREKAKEMEKEIGGLLSKKDKQQELSAKLKEYDGLIMTLIHKHHLDVPPKKDKTKLVG